MPDSVASNIIKLSDLGEMTPQRIDSLSIDDISMLANELVDMKANYDRYREYFNLLCDHRFMPAIRPIRAAQKRPSGTVRIKEDRYQITQDISKRVKWDQEKLGALDAQIRAADRNPREYIDVEYKVPERRYADWPAEVRESFEPARTVVHGNTTYEIEIAKE